jgi:hypothetical protein
MAPGEEGTGDHSREVNLDEALVALHPLEGRHSLPEAVDRPMIIALGPVCEAEVLARHYLQDDIPAGRGDCEGALGGGDGLVIRASVVEMEGQKARDLSQPTPIVDGRREGLGLAQQRQHALEITGWKERRAQGEPEIDGLLDRIRLLWQMRDGAEGLLKVPYGFPVG